MWTEVTLISHFVRFDWFGSNCCVFFSSVSDESRVNKAWCLVVVFGARLCWGGGGVM